MAYRFRNENKIRWRISVGVNFSFIYFSISNQNTLGLKWELMIEGIKKKFHFQQTFIKEYLGDVLQKKKRIPEGKPKN